MTEEAALEFSNRDGWRRWLDANHRRGGGVWVVLRKKNSTISAPTYDEALDEALCYGWIDGKMKSIDSERFIQWFSPRRRGSMWSLSNKNRFFRLLAEERMMPAGLESVDEAKKNGRWDNAYTSKGATELPVDLRDALQVYPEAYSNFMRFPDSSRFMYIHWVNDAKRSGTRERRIMRVVERSRNNLRPGIDL